MLLATHLTLGQQFAKMDTVETPTKLREIIPQQIELTIRVDFTGDEQYDYICKLKHEPANEPTYKEIWISSEMKIIKTLEKYPMDYDFFWLINIDNDPEPEILNASGFSDGIDYWFSDQNLLTGIDEILFYFSPIIVETNKTYWGYPWDITSLSIKTENAHTKLKCSLDHTVSRDDDYTLPDWQKALPIIVFQGRPTQPEMQTTSLKNCQWLTIEKIKVNLSKTINK